MIGLFLNKAWVVIFLFLASCGYSGEVVNVYTSRHYEVDEAIFKQFETESGIRVNLVKANADQLIKRLSLEGQNSPADLLITVDAGRLNHAKNQGLLQSITVREGITNRLTENLQDPEGYWFGITKRARVIVYHKEHVNPAELSTYEALADEKWKGELVMRSSQNIYNQSLLASMIAAQGENEAAKWAKSVVDNLAISPRGNDRDQVKAIASGTGKLSLVNTYYLGLMLNSSNAEERKIANEMGIFFPNQDDRGTHINISGVGITKSAKNIENAHALIRFLLREDIQSKLSGSNYEYPAAKDVEPNELLQGWGNFKEDSLHLSELGKYHVRAIELFNENGWQ